MQKCASYKVQYKDDNKITECAMIFSDMEKALGVAKSTKKQHEMTRIVGQEYDGRPWGIQWSSHYNKRGMPLF